MRGQVRKTVIEIGVALFIGLALALAVPQVQAGIIATDAGLERDRVRAMLEQPELAAELSRMGVAPDEAKARVNAMTPQEVSQLAGRLDAAAAGGAASNRDLLLVILLVLLLILIL